jgi:uncharacterized OB-fold protein
MSIVPSVDRCDRCGAEALVRVELVSSGLPLTFCAHHYSEQAGSLVSVAVVTDDERGRWQVAAVAG